MWRVDGFTIFIFIGFVMGLIALAYGPRTDEELENLGYFEAWGWILWCVIESAILIFSWTWVLLGKV